ncbi:MAG: flagellar biosynthesis protein FlhF [Methylococcaceae bacterium]|nr:MAG: flagellar biosynthesis protein FlhF [Methylococcaceae bacterium]
MKIKRYFAADIRQAMRMVREEQGPDAVILSNRRVEGGVEIVAALDFDEQSLQEKLAEPAPEAAPSPAQHAAQPSRAMTPETVKAHIPQPSAATVELLARLRGAAPAATGSASPSQRLAGAMRETSDGRAAPARTDQARAAVSALSARLAPEAAVAGRGEGQSAQRAAAKPAPSRAPAPPVNIVSQPRAKPAAAPAEVPRPVSIQAAAQVDAYLAESLQPAVSRAEKPAAPQHAFMTEAPHSGPLSAREGEQGLRDFRGNPSETSQEPAHRKTAASAPAEREAGSMSELQQELRALRKVVDMRLSEAGWQASARNQNITRLDLLRGLCERGFSKAVALHLANRLGSLTDVDAAWRQAKEILTRQLPVADDQLLDYGGIAALVGPTGVGKTTTIAKLAAKFRLKHGPRQLALITVDNYRIAAHDHLHTYGRILDVPVAIAGNADELQYALQGFLDKKLVLIDTAGMGQRDGRLMEQLALLRDSSIPVKPYLVMSASTQLRGLEEVVRAFGDCQPQACILTKLDEAASPATALSVLMQQGLPLSFVADGQQVPEDLHVARSADLLQQCFSAPLADQGGTDSFTFEDWVANGTL